MKTIDLESHFYTRDYIAYLRQRKTFPYEVGDGASIKLYHNKDLFSPRGLKLEESLLDLGKGRIEFMDKNGIDVQAISLTNPSVQLFSSADGTAWARRTNDELSEVLKKYPGRFIGLAAVAPQDPRKAAYELERAVTKLGIQGVCLYSHVRNEYLDNPKYWAVFEAAERLDVPVYLHPGMPSALMLGAYQDYGYPLAGPRFCCRCFPAYHASYLQRPL